MLGFNPFLLSLSLRSYFQVTHLASLIQPLEDSAVPRTAAGNRGGTHERRRPNLRKE